MILPRELESFWLDDDMRDTGPLCNVLAPYPAGAMEVYEVSSRVNRPSNDGPEVVVPVGEEASPVPKGHAGPRLL